MVTTEDHL